jgi:CRISPR/Cas system-associated protein Csx1
LYQISLSYYNEAHLKESVLFAKRVVEEYPNVDYYCASAKYTIAFHKSIKGDYVSAIDDYLSIVEQFPTVEFIPIVLTKIGDSFLSLDRQAEAVYVYDTLANLYPYRKEGICAAQSRNFVLHGRPDLKEALEKAKLTNGANLDMKKLPESLALKIPPFLERLDKIKKKIELVMIQNPDRGESIEDRVFEIK